MAPATTEEENVHCFFEAKFNWYFDKDLLADVSFNLVIELLLLLSYVL